jgi:hypothetical protein
MASRTTLRVGPAAWDHDGSPGTPPQAEAGAGSGGRNPTPASKRAGCSAAGWLATCPRRSRDPSLAGFRLVRPSRILRSWTLSKPRDRALSQRRVGWQPSRFFTERVEAERAFALAEQLGSVNAAAQQLDTTWPSLRKTFTRHGPACLPATLTSSGSGRSPPPASEPGSRPPRPWTRFSWPSTLTPSRPESGQRPSCMSRSRFP